MLSQSHVDMYFRPVLSEVGAIAFASVSMVTSGHLNIADESTFHISLFLFAFCSHSVQSSF